MSGDGRKWREWQELAGNVGDWRENVRKMRESAGNVGDLPGGDLLQLRLSVSSLISGYVLAWQQDQYL